MIKAFNRLQPFGALVLRLILGTAMLYHGWDKVIPAGGLHAHNYLSALDRYSHYIANLGIPYWLGYVSALTEFLGGILLILGLLTRLMAFFVTVNMLVAILFVNRHHGYASSEYSLALFAIALMLLFYGAGSLALDRRFRLS
jgi:putative oxidoreductase